MRLPRIQTIAEYSIIDIRENTTFSKDIRTFLVHCGFDDQRHVGARFFVDKTIC